MTEQQACALCGAEGHTAAQCNWRGASLISALQTIADFPCAAQDNMPAANMRKIARDALDSFRQHPEQVEGTQGEPLPYWEPCNPACDPELNGFRDRKCSCEQASAVLAQPSPTAPELPAEDEPEAAGLGYPIAKEEAVKLWYAGFRSEVITVLEAWEAIGHDIGMNPDKGELLSSLRYMLEKCEAHDAAQARVAELELKLDKSDYAYDCDRNHMRSLAEQAIERAKVFDDGSDGADAESARSVVAILGELLADVRVPVAQSGQVPEGIRVLLSPDMKQIFVPSLPDANQPRVVSSMAHWMCHWTELVPVSKAQHIPDCVLCRMREAMNAAAPAQGGRDE